MDPSPFYDLDCRRLSGAILTGRPGSYMRRETIADRGWANERITLTQACHDATLTRSIAHARPSRAGRGGRRADDDLAPRRRRARHARRGRARPRTCRRPRARGRAHRVDRRRARSSSTCRSLTFIDSTGVRDPAAGADALARRFVPADAAAPARVRRARVRRLRRRQPAAVQPTDVPQPAHGQPAAGGYSANAPCRYTRSHATAADAASTPKTRTGCSRRSRDPARCGGQTRSHAGRPATERDGTSVEISVRWQRRGRHRCGLQQVTSRTPESCVSRAARRHRRPADATVAPSARDRRLRARDAAGVRRSEGGYRGNAPCPTSSNATATDGAS